MTDRKILARALTREAFAPFGDVIDKTVEARAINAGKARRFSGQAFAQVQGAGARVTVGLVEAAPYAFPLELTMVERHPLGSQAFVPIEPLRFLVVVCPDENGKPGRPQAFVTDFGQGVNYHAGTWHGVLTPIEAVQTFVVVDRVGEGDNTEEHEFDKPWTLHLPGMTA